jgi:hypothetical protein
VRERERERGREREREKKGGERDDAHGRKGGWKEEDCLNYDVSKSSSCAGGGAAPFLSTVTWPVEKRGGEKGARS